MIQEKGSTWIASELNRLGIRTKNKVSGHFSRVAIRRLIRNETYKDYSN
ncbi:recombinase family protein [Anaerobacillus sp. HL2]|nr:recombinase family protein [Anaerobacillus sp. HL2]